MRRDLADQRDVFFFYLAVISYANSTCKVKKAEDVDDSCHLKLLSQRELCPVLSSRPSPMSVDWLATSVFHFSLAVAASAPVSERSVKLRKTKRLTGSTRLGFIVPTFTAIPL